MQQALKLLALLAIVACSASSSIDLDSGLGSGLVPRRGPVEVDATTAPDLDPAPDLATGPEAAADLAAAVEAAPVDVETVRADVAKIDPRLLGTCPSPSAYCPYTGWPGGDWCKPAVYITDRGEKTRCWLVDRASTYPGPYPCFANACRGDGAEGEMARVYVTACGGCSP